MLKTWFLDYSSLVNPLSNQFKKKANANLFNLFDDIKKICINYSLHSYKIGK